jgi:transposase
MAGNAARWRDLPEVFGKWTAIHARFRRCSRNGVFENLFYVMADMPMQRDCQTRNGST